jgi:hypothetical protein
VEGHPLDGAAQKLTSRSARRMVASQHGDGIFSGVARRIAILPVHSRAGTKLPER